MKKPEDILKYGKNLHLPAGSVLIPYLQTAADEKLQEIFKKTNEGNKAPIYFYHSPILSFMHSTFFSTSLTLRVKNQRSLKRRSLIPVMHLFACQTWLRLAWGYGIIKLWTSKDPKNSILPHLVFWETIWLSAILHWQPQLLPYLCWSWNSKECSN